MFLLARIGLFAYLCTQKLNRMEQQHIDTLKEIIEQAAGRKIKTPRDFDFLADCIFEKVHEHISPTTLKRMWGYINDAGAAPRKSTLDILARFVDYPDWAAFCDASPSTLFLNPSTEQGASPTPSLPPPSAAPSTLNRAKRSPLLITASVLILLIVIVFLGKALGIGGFTKEKPILRQGQTFATYDDYLSIFGLKSDPDHDFFIRLPDYEYTVLWAPRYKHPNWHNEGDSAALMPTITEYYHPANYPTDSASLAELARINKERYINAIRIDEVRLIFMKNLVDTNFVFLGVYRLSTTLSDSSRVVWRRVRTDFDPNHLEVLKTYRY